MFAFHRASSVAVPIFLVLASCGEPARVAPPTNLVAVPKVAPSASPRPLVVTPEKPRPTGDFALVVVSRDKHPLFVHAAGDRAIVSMGTGLWGSATKGKKPTADASLGAGLPTSGENHVQSLGGHWPDVAVVHGAKQFIHYGGAEPQLFANRGGRFVLDPNKLEEVPRGVQRTGEDTFVFVPTPSHYQDGAQAVLERPSCKAKAKRDALVTVSRGASKRPVPKVPATFFMQAIADDGEGRPWAVGADVCAPGAYVGMLADASVNVERIPGSDGCKIIDEAEGVVLTHAHLFPAATGLYALLVNEPPSLGENVPSTGPCVEPPTLLRREKAGTWSPARALPPVSHAYVDSAGTYWGFTAKGTVLRVPEAGASKELVIGPTCLSPLGENDRTGRPLVVDESEPFASLVVPFPDQPMIVVRYQDGARGLCTVEP